MSFSNINGGQPQGTQLDDCSAGTPVGGLDSTNIFRIIKLTSAGSITTNVPLPIASTPYSVDPIAGTPTGAVGIKIAGLALSFTAVLPAISAGLYEIAPYVNLEANTGGSLSFLLIKSGSSLDIYVNTLAFGVDPFAPTAANVNNGGLACFWHNVSVNKIGTGALAYATGATALNITKTAFLTAGSYNLICVVDTAVTTTGTGQLFAGFTNINRIG